MRAPTLSHVIAATPSREAARSALRMVALAFFGLGAVTLALGTVLPDSDPSDHGGLLILAALSGAAAALVAAWRRPPAAVLLALPPAGTLLVTGAMAVSTPLGGTFAFYLWPLVAAAYFLNARGIALNLVFFAACLAGVLGLGLAGGERAMMFVDTAVPVTGVTVLVAALKRRMGELVERLSHMATIDGLTGALNHTAFTARLDEAAALSERSGTPLSLVLFDLDHFKRVNDRFGHQEGDRVLRRVCEIVETVKRQSDVLGRLGGEEFAVILPDTELDGALHFAERLREAVRDGAPLTLSAGVAERREHTASGRDLLHEADRALYTAKRGGRDRSAVPAAA